MLKFFVAFVEAIRQRVVWPRYGWFLIFAPALIVLGAEALPSLLTGLLLLRIDEPVVAWRDLFLLSFLTSSVVAFGIAQVRIIDLYGQLRFNQASETTEPKLHNPTHKYRSGWYWWYENSTGWPLAIWLLWLVSSSIYPLFSLQKTLRGASLPGNAFVPGDSWYYQSSMLLGLGATLLAFLLLSIVQLLVSRKAQSACGLMPLENVAGRLIDAFVKRPLEAQPSGRQWLWNSPGFTMANSRTILPGHMQLAFLFAVAICIYCGLFWQSYRTDGWPPQYLPVGVYVLLLMASVGGLASWLAFLLGRYRIPLWLPILAYGFLAAMLGPVLPIDTHRYFGLLQSATPPAVQTAIDKLSDDTDNAFINALKNRPAKISEYDERRTLYNIYDEWRFPRGPDGKRTMIVVTASGGGIQAAAWTARVLFGLEGLIKDFRRSIGLISSVSGGSVGTMYYLAQRPSKIPDDLSVEQAQQAAQSAEAKVQKLLQNGPYASSLEAVSWGLAFPDLVRTILPLKKIFDPELDRGWSLESTWWTRMGRNADDVALMQELRIRDLIRPTNDHLIPPVVFNATAVETGQRIMISPVITSDITSSEKLDHYEVLTSPIDLLDYYEPLVTQPKAVNPRLTAAVRLSASFAYVTPVALPLFNDEQLLRSDANLPHQRKYVHICDGGYSDNTGLVAAVRLISELLNHYKQLEEDPPFDRIVIFCIEPFAESPITVEESKSGLISGLAGPGLALTNARVTTQAERALLEQNLLVLANGSRLEVLKSLPELNLLTQVQSDFGQLQQEGQAVSGALQKMEKEVGWDQLLKELKETTKPIEKLDATHVRVSPEIQATREVNIIRSRLNQPALTKALTSDFAQTREALEAVDVDAAQAWVKLHEHYQATSQSLEKASAPASDSNKTEASESKPFKLNVEILTAPIRFNPEADYVTSAAAIAQAVSQTTAGDSAERAAPGTTSANVNSPSAAPIPQEVSRVEPRLKSVPSPPLSWVLSPWDQSRLDIAWREQAKRLMEGPKRELGPGDLAGEPTPRPPVIGYAGPADDPTVKKAESNETSDPLKSGNALAPLRQSAIKPEGFRSIFKAQATGLE